MQIPTYDEIKQLDRSRDYEWNLFKIVPSVYTRLTYNEDNNKCLCLDIMIGGYCNCTKFKGTKYETNKFYKLTKKNYEGLLKTITELKEYVIKNMESDNIYG